MNVTQMGVTSMEITQYQKKKIEGISNGIICPYNFRCNNSKFGKVAQGKDDGTRNLLECIEENPQGCKFSSCFGKTFRCLCPIRVYIADELNN